MKKYVMLFTFTFIVVGSMVIISVISRNSVVPVNAVKVNAITVENSVTCTGRVERIASTTVRSTDSGTVNGVFVKTGDKVRVGQPLLAIQTIDHSLSSSSSSVVPGLPSGLASGLPSGLPDDYESLLSLYGNRLSSENSKASSESSAPVKNVKTIVSPVEGEITSISVADQSYVSSGTSVAVIADKNGLQVRLSVNESQISDIKIGQKAVITGVGFKNSTYTGKVESISTEAKQEITGTGQETVVEVIVSVENAKEDIKPGYTAKVKIITSQDSNVLVVPYEAVRADKNGSEYVFKVEGNQAVKTPITTRQEYDSGFEVTKGLKNHDLVVESPDELSNGARVILNSADDSGKNQVSSDD